MKDYKFKEHVVELEYEVAFDGHTANDLLKQIRNSIQIFKRAYSDRPLTPDLWVQIDRIDHIAHGGDTFHKCISTEVQNSTQEAK